jgi:lysozyme
VDFSPHVKEIFMTLTGIDISKWNGEWNAPNAKAAGAAFVFIKASQAAFIDPKFLANWQKAKDAGLLQGAYHYMDYTKSVRESANFFATILSNYPGELPPVVDYEQTRTDNNTNAARAYLREFLEILRARGHKPIIYTSSSFWSAYGDKNSYWTGFPLWLAHYTTATNPSVPLPWIRWTFWQYSSKGTGATYGTESFNVDMNRFDGNMDDLDAFAGIRRPSIVELEKRIITLEQRTSTLEQKISSIEQSIAALKTTTTSSTQSPAPQPQTPAPTPQSPSPAPQPAPVVSAICMALGLNVRSGPGPTYPVVGGLVSGQRVKVLERQNGWARSESPAGWSSEQYLKFV